MKIEIDGVEYLPAVDLRKVAVRDTEREKELEAEVQKLKEMVEKLKHSNVVLGRAKNTWRNSRRVAGYKIEKLESELTVARGIHHDLRSELSTLREQSERKCYTLGEPLTQKQFYDTLPQTPLIVITKCGDMEVGNRNDFVWESHSKFYLDPRPLPTLPAPDPEEQKTLWMVRYKSIAGEWVTKWHNSEREADEFLHNCKPEAKATKQAYTIEPRDDSTD